MGRVIGKITVIVLLFAVLLLVAQGCAGKKAKEPLGPDASTIDKLWRGLVEDVTQ